MSVPEKDAVGVVAMHLERTQMAKGDAAFEYLQTHIDNTASIQTSAAYTRRIRRKVDLLVMPFLMLCYVLNFMDKVLLNYAAVMGLPEDLKLTGNDFSNASSAFYIAVLLFMFPNVWLLQKLPTGKYLGVCIIGWGLSTACHAALKDNVGLVVVRVFCGIFEAAVPSALMLLSSQYYNRSEQTVRYSYWYCGMGVGQILGGLSSWGFQHIVRPPTAALQGWKIMFLSLGLATLFIGALICVAVPDTPMKAWFLSDEEKVSLLEHIKSNQTGIEGKKFQPKHLKEGAMDPQLWLMMLIVTLQGTGGGALVAYSSTLLTSFGYTPRHAALLNMPSGAVNMASAFSCGFLARNFGRRFLWTICATAVGVAGAALMSFGNQQGAKLAGMYLANFIIGATPLDYQWITNNTAGHTKRALVTAMMNASFALGNIIGPQTFRAKDAPTFKPARISLVCTWASSIAIALILVTYYVFENRRHEKLYGPPPEEISEAQGFAGLTDKENTDFRYTY